MTHRAAGEGLACNRTSIRTLSHCCQEEEERWWDSILVHRMRDKSLEFLSDRFSIVLMQETAKVTSEYATRSGRIEGLRKGFEVGLWATGE